MDVLQIATSDPAEWLGWALLAALAGCLAALLVCAAFAWRGYVVLRTLEHEGRKLDQLEELRALLGRLVAERGDLDLRRLEHVLLDIRDGQRLVVDQLLRAAESAGAARAASDAPAPATLGERVVNRMLALGYERVQVVTDAELLADLRAGDGEVLVEAHRQGVLHKGRILVRGGRVTDVDVHPTYSIFP